ncbi:MAG: phage shock protein PspA [Gammaproteobacteria bacterium]|nr:phage shock protein PspA [Gammaproteobacteria bacterium]
MGMFSRLSDIINSNLNAMLDKAEDPEKLIKYLIQEMEETLAEARASSVKLIADKKELARKQGTLAKDIAGWQEKAEIALTKDREDLARAALTEKARLEDMAASMAKEVALVDEATAKLSDDLVRLSDKLNEARARRDALIMRGKTATARLKVRKQLDDGHVHEAFHKFEQVERRMDRLEAAVEAYDLGQGRSLNAQISELVSNEKVEQELAALKARMNTAA